MKKIFGFGRANSKSSVDKTNEQRGRNAKARLMRRGRSSRSTSSQNHEESELGFLSRSGRSNLLELDDEALEELVGPATHISLGRKTSKGRMIKVPSKERFGNVSFGRRPSSFQKGSNEEASLSNRPQRSPHPEKDFEEWLDQKAVDGNVDDLDEFEENDESSSGDPEKKNSDLSRKTSKRKLTRNPSKERLDAMIRDRRAGMY